MEGAERAVPDRKENAGACCGVFRSMFRRKSALRRHFFLWNEEDASGEEKDGEKYRKALPGMVWGPFFREKGAFGNGAVWPRCVFVPSFFTFAENVKKIVWFFARLFLQSSLDKTRKSSPVLFYDLCLSPV